jgi:quinol monooxygenase YgiN
MWAQLIRARLHEGHEDAVERLMEQFQAIEKPGSGLIRSTAMRDQHDPRSLYLLVVFESEEQARVREADPERAERIGPARELMAAAFDGAPEFTDLEVVTEFTP